MSWAEVVKINDNMSRPLNEQLRDGQYKASYFYTTSGTFKVPKTGIYKVIVVGAGGTSSQSTSTIRTGGAGGVAIKTIKLTANDTYSVSVDSSTTKFSTICSATAGGNATSSGYGEGGSGTGGDFNYTGNSGTRTAISTASSNYCSVQGASVGVFIPELMREITISRADNIDYAAKSGFGIYGHGAGQGTSLYYSTSSGNITDIAKTPVTGGCVLIIPLEFTE